MRLATISVGWRAAIVAALAFVGLTVLMASASAQSRPPLLLYGDGQAGDTITVTDDEGEQLGTTTVETAGVWSVQVQCDSDVMSKLRFAVNDVAVDVLIRPTGEGHASVTLMAPKASEDSGDEPVVAVSETASDAAEAEDAMSSGYSTMDMSEDDEALAEDSEPALGTGGGAAAEEGSDDEYQVYPVSGSGGLADRGPSTSALIGTLAVLASLALGLGVWRVRRRA
ncbi:MAG: hypothetical protein F4Z51_05460 [Chloroflexi bacterium]|nr:hypothetical protein [Chloroflexota bacterium]MYD17781.1 hypothetical protein [Chloroflexota bacterium]